MGKFPKNFFLGIFLEPGNIAGIFIQVVKYPDKNTMRFRIIYTYYIILIRACICYIFEFIWKISNNNLRYAVIYIYIKAFDWKKLFLHKNDCRSSTAALPFELWIIIVSRVTSWDAILYILPKITWQVHRIFIFRNIYRQIDLP